MRHPPRRTDCRYSARIRWGRAGWVPRVSWGVCDQRGAVFGLPGAYVADASLFPASSGVNPMITIMALAKHVARGLRH